MDIHVWEPYEVTMQAKNSYDNPYAEVEIWVDLKGPVFDKRVYGFWDGGNIFKVRILAPYAGKWTWTGGSNRNDSGLNGKTGGFTAVDWTEEEKKQNSCRRWAYCAGTAEKDTFLFYFEKECPRVLIRGLLPDRIYNVRWFDPRIGKWHTESGFETMTADMFGRFYLPPFPSGEDWDLDASLTEPDQ